MATKTARNVAHIPGRLVAAPTNLSTAFPHGGTELGVVRDMEFRFGITVDRVMAEEFARPIQYFISREEAVFGCVLRSIDSDMIQRVFHNTSVGSASQERVIDGSASGSGVNRAGYFLSDKALTLLFSPYAVDQHPHILIYNAHPIVEETAALQLSLGEEVGIALLFRCVPDSSGRDYKIGRRDDLSL